MSYDLNEGAKRVVNDLKELAKLTSDEKGAQRVAWTPIWQKANDWFTKKVESFGASVTIDKAGNIWAKIEGDSEESIVIGSHLDSVPNGGWLDGALGVVSGIEILRRYSKEKPAKTIYVVSWADEEGARFGSSVMGSSAATGAFDVEGIINRVDNDGIKVQDALKAYNVDINEMLQAKDELKDKKMIKYLELHIEQGPILEEMKKEVACVYGVQGIERHSIEFTGQAAHAGSFPTLMRQDAFLAAAKSALSFREIALKYDAVCTVGRVGVEPNVPTIVPGKCTISLDQRSINPDDLIAMNKEAREITKKVAKEFDVEVNWSKIYTIEPTLFNEDLTKTCQEAVQDETGEPTTIYSGPLHDAVEMAKLVPTVMMFTMSKAGLSHCKEEDSDEEAIETATKAFIRLVAKVIK